MRNNEDLNATYWPMVSAAMVFIPSSVCLPVPFISVVRHALCSTRTKNTSRDRNVFFYHDRLHALYHDCGSPALLSWRDNRKQASGIEDDRENSQDLAERTVGGIMILRRPNRSESTENAPGPRSPIAVATMKLKRSRSDLQATPFRWAPPTVRW